MLPIQLPESQLGKTILELFALSILAGLARLFLMERTIIGGWKQFLGGIFFGSLIGYLLYIMNPRHAFYSYLGGVWRVWCVGCAVFGKEILFVFKSLIIDSLPIIKTFFVNQGDRIASAWEAYKKK